MKKLRREFLLDQQSQSKYCTSKQRTHKVLESISALVNKTCLYCMVKLFFLIFKVFSLHQGISFDLWNHTKISYVSLDSVNVIVGDAYSLQFYIIFFCIRKMFKIIFTCKVSQWKCHWFENIAYNHTRQLLYLIPFFLLELLITFWNCLFVLLFTWWCLWWI